MSPIVEQGLWCSEANWSYRKHSPSDTHLVNTHWTPAVYQWPQMPLEQPRHLGILVPCLGCPQFGRGDPPIRGDFCQKFLANWTLLAFLHLARPSPRVCQAGCLGLDPYLSEHHLKKICKAIAINDKVQLTRWGGCEQEMMTSVKCLARGPYWMNA